MARLIVKDGKQVIADYWSEGDIRQVAEDEFERELTYEETGKVMQLIVYSFDASTGINWNVIRDAVELVTGGVKDD